MSVLPRDIESAIVTPSRGEDAACPPLWLLWINRKDGDGWFLHCVANSEESARYCIECYGEQSALIVERIPANHAFASSIESDLREANHRIAAKSYSAIHGGYRRSGD